MITFTGSARSRAISINRERSQRPSIAVPGAKDFAANRLVRWLFDEARRDLEASVVRHTRLLSLKATRIAVRDQTSRWGSCSTTGALSFSWRLILAPPFVLDYVAAHEVAHLAEMNHGAGFWALVKKIRPDFEAGKQWLQVRGPDLHRYGPAHSKAR
jgi:predicted metal-dependent hydrolase